MQSGRGKKTKLMYDPLCPSLPQTLSFVISFDLKVFSLNIIFFFKKMLFWYIANFSSSFSIRLSFCQLLLFYRQFVFLFVIASFWMQRRQRAIYDGQISDGHRWFRLEEWGEKGHAFLHDFVEHFKGIEMRYEIGQLITKKHIWN